MITRTQIETGAVTTIRDGMTMLKLVSAHAGGARDVLAGVILDVPAAFVFIARRTNLPQMQALSGTKVCQLDVSITLAAISYNSQDDARTRSETGIFALEDALCDLLQDNDLGITGFAGLEWVSTTVVDSSDTRVVYRADFRCYLEA